MQKRLMCVVAHPDDECFAFGGALVLAREAGYETYVICMTDGQAATNRGASSNSDELGQMRREEFARSCAVLDVTQHELLDYQDGQLEFSDLSGAICKLVKRIRTWKPQIVLTFGLDGSLNVHPDHAAVCCFASLAFHWSARAKHFPDLGLEPFEPQRLYHQSTAFTLPDRAPLLPSPWSVALDISGVRARKDEAFRQHTSQLALLPKIQPFLDQYGDREHYVLAASTRPQAATLATSLLDAIEG